MHFSHPRESNLRLGFHASLPNLTGREAETMDGRQDDIPLLAPDWHYQFAGATAMICKQHCFYLFFLFFYVCLLHTFNFFGCVNDYFVIFKTLKSKQ